MTSISKYNLFTLAICIIALTLPLSSLAQEQEVPLNHLRFEAGLGFGSAGKGGGLSGRAALSYHHSNWGGAIRLTAHEGRESNKRPIIQVFGPPTEEFYEKAILASYIINQHNALQYIGKLGIGVVHGEMLDDNKEDFIDLNSTTGLAFEIGMSSYKRTVGWSLNLTGNINSEATFVALILSISFGDHY